MVKCPNCSSVSYYQARFCVHCGARLPSQSGAGSQSSAPPRDLGIATSAGAGEHDPAPGTKQTLPGTVSSPFAFPAPGMSGGAPGSWSSGWVARREEGVRDAQHEDAPGPAREEPAHDAVLQDEDFREEEFRDEDFEDAVAEAQRVSSELSQHGTAGSEALGAVGEQGAASVLAHDGWDGPPRGARSASEDELNEDFDDLIGVPEAWDDSTAADVTEVRKLFVQIAAEQARPLREFLVELKLGEASKAWLDVVVPATRSLRKSAFDMGLIDLCRELDKLIRAMEGAEKTKGAKLDKAAGKDILSSHEHLNALMPSVFGISEQAGRREPIILQSLLRQVPGLRKVALDKLFGAGLTSLEMYLVAKPHELVETAGIPLALADQIVDTFARYKREMTHIAASAGRSSELSRLSQLASCLAEQNASFEALARDYAPQAQRRKRALRQERVETVLQLNVLLARLGAVELVSTLERLPFADKAKEVERYLQETQLAEAQRMASGAAVGRE